MRYIKEERDKSWGSTTVNPCGLTWQMPALDGAEDDVQEEKNSAVRAWRYRGTVYSDCSFSFIHSRADSWIPRAATETLNPFAGSRDLQSKVS